jgi:hypothetical protein
MTGAKVVDGMSRDELRGLIREVVQDELRGVIRDAMQETVKTALDETFIRLGLAASDPIEAQRDFQHLRSWRKGTESLGMKVLVTALGLAVSGGLAALWLGIKATILPGGSS